MGDLPRPRRELPVEAPPLVGQERDLIELVERDRGRITLAAPDPLLRIEAPAMLDPVRAPLLGIDRGQLHGVLRAGRREEAGIAHDLCERPAIDARAGIWVDRKSTRLNSSHLGISY